MFLPVVDVRADDNSQYIHHVEAQVPWKKGNETKLSSEFHSVFKTIERLE